MAMSRRDFLSCLPAGAIVSALPRSAAPAAPRLGCQTNAWPLKPGDFPAFLAVLREMKTIGFEGFETSFRNVQAQYADPAPARASLAASGLAFFGVHIFLTEYDPRTRVAPMDLVKTTADGAAALGAQRVILSGAGLVRDGRVGDDDLALKVAGLNEAARYCRTRGLAFAYHNHGPEFAAGGAEITGLIARKNYPISERLASFVIHPNVDAYSSFDFDHAEEMIEIGYDTARRALPALRERLTRAATSGQGSRIVTGES